jgi:hypothetical protein
MARIGLQEVSGLVDPVSQYQFELIVPNVPGGGDGRSLAITCQTNSLPGQSLDPVKTTLHGVDLNFKGRPMYTQTLTAQFLVVRDLKMNIALRKWMNYAQDLKKNTGTYKTQYSTQATLLVYDAAQVVIDTITLYGFFPQTIDDQAVDGSSSAPITLGATFSYDYFAYASGE